jgi:hypothetical protein
MTAANAAPIGKNAPVPEPLPTAATEHDVFVLTVSVVVQSPPSQLVVDVVVTVALICEVSIELSAATHWPMLPALT